jgi:hypothetical protein
LAWRGDARYLFVLQIPDRAGQVQVSIHAAEVVYKSACLGDSRHFSLLLWLVIKAQCHSRSSSSTQNCSRIPSIRNGQSPTSNNCHGGSGTSMDWVVGQVADLSTIVYKRWLRCRWTHMLGSHRSCRSCVVS